MTQNGQKMMLCTSMEPDRTAEENIVIKLKSASIGMMILGSARATRWWKSVIPNLFIKHYKTKWIAHNTDCLLRMFYSTIRIG